MMYIAGNLHYDLHTALQSIMFPVSPGHVTWKANKDSTVAFKVGI